MRRQKEQKKTGECQQRDRRGAGGQRAACPFTYHCSLGCTPPFFSWQVTIDPHPTPIVSPSYTGHLLHPGPGRIQVVPVGRSPVLGTPIPKECAVSSS